MGKVVLPKGKKCAVVFTFDFDAQSLWLADYGAKEPSLLSRGEFGANVGAPRILELLDKYNIKSTWFIPGYTADTYPKIVKEIYQKGHEIGHHGYLHESPNKLSKDEERAVLIKGTNALKAITGEKPLGYRSPSWNLSLSSIELFQEHGFIYDSSLMGNDFNPYRLREGDEISLDKGIKFGKETGILEIPVTWGLDDFPQFEFLETPVYLMGLSNPSKVKEIWLGDFDYCYQHVSGGVWCLTMHPQVIGRGHRMTMLEEIIQYISRKSGIWWARMIDIAKAWEP